MEQRWQQQSQWETEEDWRLRQEWETEVRSLNQHRSKNKRAALEFRTSKRAIAERIKHSTALSNSEGVSVLEEAVQELRFTARTAEKALPILEPSLTLERVYGTNDNDEDCVRMEAFHRERRGALEAADRIMEMVDIVKKNPDEWTEYARSIMAIADSIFLSGIERSVCPNLEN